MARHFESEHAPGAGQQAAEKLDLRASTCSVRTKNLGKFNDRSGRPEALEG